MEPYEDKARWLSKKLEKVMEEGLAYEWGRLFVLAASYGAGDAWAGLILEKLAKRLDERGIGSEEICEFLRRRGFEVRSCFPRKVTQFSLWWILSDAARNWRSVEDPELREAMRKLDRYATSGGRAKLEG